MLLSIWSEPRIHTLKFWGYRSRIFVFMSASKFKFTKKLYHPLKYDFHRGTWLSNIREDIKNTKYFKSWRLKNWSMNRYIHLFLWKSLIFNRHVRLFIFCHWKQNIGNLGSENCFDNKIYDKTLTQLIPWDWFSRKQTSARFSI